MKKRFREDEVEDQFDEWESDHQTRGRKPNRQTRHRTTKWDKFDVADDE